MELVTASAAISYTTGKEEDSAKLYEDLAQKYMGDEETFLELAKENRRNKTSIQRAYYGVISDKLEACFCFEEMDMNKYPIKTELPEDISYSVALRKLIEMEETIQRFLLDAAEKAESLIPDVSWTFERVGKRRTARIEKLRSLHEKVSR